MTVDAFVVPCVGGQDERFERHCIALRELLTPTSVGLDGEVCRRCSPHAFSAAAEHLARLPRARGPQAKLRCMLRAWDCVLGVLALCTDSPSADDFLPAMACALLQAAPPMLISSVTSMVNLSSREDFEDMWVFHFVAAVGLVAQLTSPGSPSTRSAGSGGVGAEDFGAVGAGGGSEGMGQTSQSVWVDYSDREPQANPPAGAPGRSAARGRIGRGFHLGLSRTSRAAAGSAALVPPDIHRALVSGAAPAPAPAPAAAASAPPTAAAPPSAAPSALPSLDLAAALEQLLEMGFERAASIAALNQSGSSEAALQLLLDGGIGDGGISRSDSPVDDASMAQMAADAAEAERAERAEQAATEQAELASLIERKASLEMQLARSISLEAPNAQDSEDYTQALSEYRELSRELERRQPPMHAPPQVQHSRPSAPLSLHSNGACTLTSGGSAPAPAPPNPHPPAAQPSSIVRCPSCSNQLRVAASGAYACPACTTRFMVRLE
jgi:hypothetical protein